MKVSIIIPNLNGEAYIENCLDSISKLEFKDYDVIIIDNGSTDRSIEIIKNHQINAKVIQNKKNVGFAKAVNQGILISEARYVALLNNDTEVSKDWLMELYRAVYNKKDVFSVTSKMMQYQRRDLIDSAGDEYTILGWAYKRGDNLSSDYFRDSDEVFSACAGAAIYDREKVIEIGLFDEEFFAYLEDVDISYRARIYGYKILYSSSSIVYHIGSATSGSKYNKLKVELASRNNLYVIFKNMPLLQLIINFPFIVLGDLVKWLFFVKKGFGYIYIYNKWMAIRQLKKIKKTPRGKLKNYLKIEWLLFKNTVLYIRNYLK